LTVARAGKSRARKRRAGKRKGEGLSLEASSLVAVITFSLILAVAMFWAQLTPLQKLQEKRDAEVRSEASRIAYDLSYKLAAYTQTARALANEPDVRRLVQARDSIALQQRARQMHQLFPWVYRVRLLPAGIREPDTRHEPHLGFACIDMLREAESRREAPPVEVHVIGTPQQHIDIVQPVLSATGGRVVGDLQVTLKVELLNQWLKPYGKKGYLSLTQDVEGKPAVLLAEVGSLGGGDDRFMNVPVPGTRWQLNLWYPQSGLSLLNSNLLIGYGVSALMIFLVVMLLWRSLRRALEHDIENYTQMLVQEMRGEKVHQFQLLLKEFRDAARRLGNIPMGRTLERERDSDAGSLSMADLKLDDSGPSTFTADAGMSVEELDDTSAFEPQPSSAPARPAPAASTEPAAPPPALPPAEIFKAYDIRGIVGRTLTATHMQLIGQALGSEAISRGVKRIAFARDGRLSGAELGQALVKGLMASGIDVIDVGMVPTPVLYFAAHELADGSGVMLTGSHNPPDYNGVKMMLAGETLAGEAIQALKQRIDNKDFSRGQGQYQTHPISGEYTKRVVSDIKLKRPLKVVVDSGNGVAGALAPKLYRELGCEVIELYSEVDGHFPNHHPDPSQPENLRDLIEMVQSSGADLGLAFDGDGDRLGVVSPDGSIVWPDRLMMLFAADVLSRNPGAQIIFDIKCSNNLTRAIWDKGGEPVMWKTGHSLIKAKMQQTGALLAGEMSGHIFFKERWYGFDDALYAGARLLEIIAADPRPAREIFASLPDAVNTPELRISLPEGEEQRLMDELMSHADFPDANVIMIDGIRADFEDGWGLVRASNTTPSLILRFEGKDREALNRIQDRFREVLQEVDPHLSLPF
jgi:phosphomannomutase/phosphoglucomutase